MAKITKTVHVEAHDVEKVIGYKCDFPDCNNECDPRGAWEVNEVDVRVYVKQREGVSYPECGMGTKIKIDICPECFKSKLIPWLESQGVEISEEEWEY